MLQGRRFATTAHAALLALATLLPLGHGAPALAAETRELRWDDLMPPDWNPYPPTTINLDDVMDGSAEANAYLEELQAISRAAPVVEALDGQTVKLPGYVLPLDFSGTAVDEFLLVPYFGACIHVPPPPSNQIVYVRTLEPLALDGPYDAVWVTGTLHTERFDNELGDAGYTMDARGVEPYQ